MSTPPPLGTPLPSGGLLCETENHRNSNNKALILQVGGVSSENCKVLPMLKYHAMKVYGKLQAFGMSSLMEASVHLHAPTAVRTGKELSVLAAWAPRPAWNV